MYYYMSDLKEYWKKRDFSKTPEPKGEVKRVKSKETIFVIHDHYATRHHHDLRLEMDGVLKSWAIPKLIDPNSDKKVLAIQTEDHSYEYRNFNDISACELIVLLSLLGNSRNGKFKVNASEVLKKFLLHPSIQNLNARHCINAIIFSFKKFYDDSDATEYITKIYEFSGKWSVQEQRKLKL